MNDAEIRVVFDCNVLLQAAGRLRGPAAACLELVFERRVTLLTDPHVLAEATDVLNRPSVRRKFPIITAEYAAGFVDRLKQFAQNVESVVPTYECIRDPKDEPYINLAIAAGATYLVTRDTDLLDLMNEQLPEGRDFRQRFPGVTILDPVDFLNRIALHASEEPESSN